MKYAATLNKSNVAYSIYIECGPKADECPFRLSIARAIMVSDIRNQFNYSSFV